MRSLVAAVLALVPSLAGAQVPADLERERAQYAEWLATSPGSPLVARGLAPIGPGIRIGPAEAEIPLEGYDARVTEANGTVTLATPGGSRVLPRHRLTIIGDVAFHVSGRAGRSILTVYGGARATHAPSYFPYNPSLVYLGQLQPSTPRRFTTLALDGLEVEATEVGSVVVPDSDGPRRLRVYRIPEPGTEESELMIFFRDATAGKGSYPAGRFVALRPAENGQYRLDFNRARNPFCAYQTAFPCPAPWPGNTLTMAVEAGEKYQ